MKARKLISAKT